MRAASSGFEDQLYGDRRADRRYNMSLDLHYWSAKAKGPQEGKFAVTRDISTGGVLFSSDEALPIGCTIELSIEWPVLLHGVKRLRLKVCGRVVRSDHQATAVRTIRYEFYTAGHTPQAAEQTVAPGAGAKYAWAGSVLQ